MLNREEINVEIARLEYEESSYPNYAKLATLYTIRNQMDGKGREAAPADSVAPAPAEPAREKGGVIGDTDFLQAVSGKDQNGVWEILDDLMDTLRAVNPRAYQNVMSRIKAL